MAHKITVAAFDAAGDPARFPAAGEPWTPSKLYYTTWLAKSQVRALWHAARERNLPVTFGEPEADEAPDWGTPDELITAHIDARDFVPAKLDSLRAHRTQIKRDSTFLQLPDDLAREYFGQEGFRLAQTRVAAPDTEDDLFAGLRG
jgi:mycothiol S-conjugate amidase